MSSLQNLQISQTFPGLIKTNDEAAIDGTLRTLQDGAGNNLPMEVSTAGVNFTGTVTGLPTASAVSSLNLLDGDLTLVAGTNVTITDDGNTNITINAAGGGGGGSVAVSMPYAQLSGPSGGDAIGNSVLIPANTFANGDMLQINGTIIKNNPSGWQYLAMWINTDNTTLFGGVQLGTDQSPQTGTELPVLMFKTISISTNDSRTYGGDWNKFYDTTNTTVALDADINWALDQYLNFVYFIDAAGGTCTIENITIAKIN
tara:strand:- start:2129 stop:2902 length:774 start_codon:yes stop_codon:yes gene_type:complete